MRRGGRKRQRDAALADKYGGSGADAYHHLRALSYFEDAQAQPMPEMLVPVDWSGIRRFFEEQVRRLADLEMPPT